MNPGIIIILIVRQVNFLLFDGANEPLGVAFCQAWLLTLTGSRILSNKVLFTPRLTIHSRVNRRSSLLHNQGNIDRLRQRQVEYRVLVNTAEKRLFLYPDIRTHGGCIQLTYNTDIENSALDP